MNGLIFCTKCDNVMLYFKDEKGKKFVHCMVCGNVDEFKKEEEAKDFIEEVKVDDHHFYNFPNKEASRLLIKKYLIEMGKRGYTRPFGEMKVLILTYIDGLDFKQVLLPLGFQKKNVTIVEVDDEVYEKIDNDPFFDECRKIPGDLKDVQLNKRFDFMYLDFKSNLCPSVVNMIINLIVNNAKENTIMYVNVLAGRETPETKEMLNQLGSEIGDSCDTVIEEKNKYVSGFKESLGEALRANLKDGDKISVRLNGGIENFDISSEPVSAEAMKGDCVEDLLERCSEMLTSEEKKVKEGLNKKNKHLLRKKAVRIYSKNACDVFLNFTDELKHLICKPKKMNIPIDNKFFPKKSMGRKKRIIMPLLRYSGRILNPMFFMQFIYKSKHAKTSIPFLSNIFILKDLKGLFRERGFKDFSDLILKAGKLISYWNEDVIRFSNLTNCLNAFHELISSKNKNIHEINEDSRKALFLTRNAFTELKSLGLVKPDGEILKLHCIGSDLLTTTYTKSFVDITNSIKRMGHKVKNLDLSVDMLAYYIAYVFLWGIEMDLTEGMSLGECPDISLEEGEDVNVVVEKKFSEIFTEDPIINKIKKMRDDVITWIALFDRAKNTTAEEIRRVGAEASIPAETIIEDFKKLGISFRELIDAPEEKIPEINKKLTLDVDNLRFEEGKRKRPVIEIHVDRKNERENVNDEKEKQDEHFATWIDHVYLRPELENVNEKEKQDPNKASEMKKETKKREEKKELEEILEKKKEPEKLEAEKKEPEKYNEINKDVITHIEKDNEQTGGEPGVKAKEMNDAMKETINKFIDDNPELKALELATMINQHYINTRGFDPKLTMPQLCAFKHWNKKFKEEMRAD